MDNCLESEADWNNDIFLKNIFLVNVKNLHSEA